MSIKDERTEQLAAEVAAIAGESKTEAIRQALIERRAKLAYRAQSPPDVKKDRVLEFLEREVWPLVPADQLGRRLTRSEEDDLLGYGQSGV